MKALTPFTCFTVRIDNEEEPRVTDFARVDHRGEDGRGQVVEQRPGLTWPEYKLLWKRQDQEQWSPLSFL